MKWQIDCPSMMDDFLSDVKMEILGPEPDCKKAQAGYIMARCYFTPVICEAEKDLPCCAADRAALLILLTKGFQFSSMDIMKHFYPEAQDVVRDCTARFRKKYQPLADRLGFSTV